MNCKTIICTAGTLICITFGSGCVITKIHTMPVKQFNAPYDKVYDSVLTYLNKEQEPILAADKEKGMISTDWIIIEKVFSAKRYRYDIRIAKIDENITSVGILSPQEAYDMGDWEEVLPSERRARRIFSFIKTYNPVSGAKSAVLVTSGVSERPFNKRRR